MSRSRYFRLAAAVIPVVVLSSCAVLPLSPPSGEAEPAPSPSMTSGGGAFVDLDTGEVTESPVRVVAHPSPKVLQAATEAFERFQSAYSRASNSNSYVVADFEPYVAGPLLETLRADDGHLYRDGSTTIGSSRTTGIDPMSWYPDEGVLEAFVCENVSDVRLLAADGSDVTPAGRSGEYQSAVTITGLPDDPRVENYMPYQYLDEC